ncbi:M20 aminoacylase family protein [Azospirillum doebereinerae]|uniref:Amidohydrolase n=1 Tax=Azospirillum doebereinerae TaxID=92933 RepID=A0A3S0X7E3_9PROT|nr:M20 aminoacylase family protein [Azospirillum doebereinerae]MCG5240509.1 M20 family metallopeptidase [Azospirillum doebereinerae]RUQ63689.1 amidohydrolase [Azospirillum doebereinerae]
MVETVAGIDGLTADVTAWRHDLHAHPETAFEEVRTSDFVAEKLTSFGLEVHRGLAKTGVVGILRNGEGPSVAFRADMDALHIQEETNLPYRSRNPGRMHACGHDGHTAMLLGAARHLSEKPNFQGSIAFVFQPAEENDGGGRVMVEEGLFDRFPVERIFGMHNWPGLDVGRIALRPGPIMAAYDVFELTLTGRGTHAAMPNLGTDTILVGSQIVAAFQTIPARNVHPVDAAVVSVTQFHAGDTWNVLPATAVLRGTVRTFRGEVQDLMERRMGELATAIAKAYGVEASLRYERRYPATVNSAAETEIARQVAVRVVGESAVDLDPMPSMGAEDFAFMLQKRPGSYVWIGAGPSDGGRNLHSPHYDFNDAVLPIGLSYWVRLAETLMPKAA